ncbi:hydroxyethylthiazole kinase [Acinetobacter chinensis]|jgi:hydroxyethylthiazole kinase|uniref:hydroxyethylthiazole kinase n=1 Tax=Acinetobacter chinensis TaxID=2004650 RepID=UPI00293498ED|nr:hydroxyethylthiazole kinase [Acinetobacter chinensis]WOE42873.1 hydroxyethylthiazole kinase [Acinetobacter chinensis]
MNHPEHLENILTDTLVTEPDALLQKVTEAWRQLQIQQPLVQCITNSVAANYVANILLAAGASPAMIDNPFEAEAFAQVAAAVSLNTGTPTSEQMEAMRIAARTAHQTGTPWVIDPVGYSPLLKWRSDLVNEILQYKPAVIRGNASEISTLAGNQVNSKGVDSTLSSNEVYNQAKVLLNHAECIAISGESDYILCRSTEQIIKINGGSHLQPKVTATGCALGALIAAYTAVSSVEIATIAAHVHFAIAGKLAYETAQKTGSFNVTFMDYINGMNAELIQQYADIELIS